MGLEDDAMLTSMIVAMALGQTCGPNGCGTSVGTAYYHSVQEGYASRQSYVLQESSVQQGCASRSGPATTCGAQYGGRTKVKFKAKTGGFRLFGRKHCG